MLLSTAAQTEIVARHVNYTALLQRGERLMEQQSVATDEVQKMMTTLEEVWASLNDSWDTQKTMLTQLYDLKVCIHIRN